MVVSGLKRSATTPLLSSSSARSAPPNGFTAGPSGPSFTTSHTLSEEPEPDGTDHTEHHSPSRNDEEPWDRRPGEEIQSIRHRQPLTQSPSKLSQAPSSEKQRWTRSESGLRSEKSAPINGYSNPEGKGGRGLPHTQSAQPSTGGLSERLRPAFGFLNKGAHRRKIPKQPLIRKPLGGDNKRWLKEEHYATEWLNLFYDLVVVAVVTIFSSTHEIQTPSVIPIFISYFVVIAWVWAAQIRYDTRYQADDVYHRIVKSLQMATFVYIGAASGHWNPNLIQNPDHIPGISTKDALAHNQARESFTTIVGAFAASRGLLGLQYFICVVQGYRAKRKYMGPLLWPTAALVLSTILCVIATVLHSNTGPQVKAKVGLFYASIGLEIAVWRIQLYIHQHGHVDTADLADRYGAFTLIILGEGFISIIRALNNVISGLDEDTGSTYGQVILAITILVMTWMFLFNRFDKHDEISQGRALLWEGLHFPLHFSMLLLLAAMVNSILNISIYAGVEAVANGMDEVVGFLNNGTMPTPQLQETLTNLLDRLDLIPSYKDEFQILVDLHASENRTQDPNILEYQYWAQIMVQVFGSYGIELPENAEESYETLYGLNTSSIGEDLSERRENATDLLIEVISATSDKTASGILWLFPSAGGVLICAAFRSMLWYRYEGHAHLVVHGIQILAGLALCLLALLDIGSLHLDVPNTNLLVGTAPIYQLLGSRSPLIIVAMTYFGVYYLTLILLNILHRIWGGVFDERDLKEYEEGEGEGGGQVEPGIEGHHVRDHEGGVHAERAVSHSVA